MRIARVNVARSMAGEGRGIKRQIISSAVAFVVIVSCCLVLLLAPPSVKVVSASPDTFGYQPAGSPSNWQSVYDRITGSWFTPSSSGTVTSISAYVYDPEGPEPYKFAIYRKNDNVLIGYTGEGYAPPTGGWLTLNIASGGSVTGDVDYYLVAWGTGVVNQIGYDTEVGKGGHQSFSYGAFPNPWSPTVGDNKCWIYATYTGAGPAQPQLYLPENEGTADNTNPYFEWTNGENATSHNFVIDDDSGFGSINDNHYFTGSDNSHTIPAENSLSDTTTYYWKVVAINENGENESGVFNFTVSVPPTVKPTKPSLYMPENEASTDNCNPYFEWTNGENAENHNFVLDDDSGFGSINDNWYYTGSENSRTIPAENTLTQGTTYYWKVIAINENGENESDVYNLTPKLYPTQPQLFVPDNESAVENCNPYLEWTNGSNAENHNFVIDDDPSFGSINDNHFFTGADNSHTIPTENSLTKGETYYWKVIAINENGENVSEVYNFSVKVYPTQPQLYLPENESLPDNCNPYFEWTNPENADNWNFVIDDDSNFGSPDDNHYFTSDNHHTISSENTLSQGVKYYWKVIGINEDGENSSGVFWFIPKLYPSQPTPYLPENEYIVDNCNPYFEWTKGADAENHNFVLDDDSNFGSVNDNHFFTDDNYHTIPAENTLTFGTTYYWKVIAINENGENASSVFNFTPGRYPDSPALYLPVENFRTNNRIPYFEWSNGENAENHRVLVDTDSNFGSPDIDETIVVPDNSFTPAPADNLSRNQLYYWKVIAVNENGGTSSAVREFIIPTWLYDFDDNNRWEGEIAGGYTIDSQEFPHASTPISLWDTYDSISEEDNMAYSDNIYYSIGAGGSWQILLVRFIVSESSPDNIEIIFEGHQEDKEVRVAIYDDANGEWDNLDNATCSGTTDVQFYSLTTTDVDNYIDENDSIWLQVGGNGEYGGPYFNIDWVACSLRGGTDSAPPHVTQIGAGKVDTAWVNSVHMPEDYMEIKFRVYDHFSDIQEVKVEWYNGTGWENVAMNDAITELENDGGRWVSYYYFENMTSLENEKDYSFNIWAKDNIANEEKGYEWMRRDVNWNLVRRYVRVGYEITDNLQYSQFYMWQSEWDSQTPDAYSQPVLEHEQIVGSGSLDTGYLLKAIPTADVQKVRCGATTYIWVNDNMTVEEGTHVDNIYVHVWWKTDSGDGHLFWGHSPEKLQNGQTLTLDNDYAEHGLNIHGHYLEASFWDTDDYLVDSNDIYELQSGSTNCDNPEYWSDRAYGSFIILNIPDNDTLKGYNSDNDNLNDWEELYETYTNPFLTDTDNDGLDDCIDSEPLDNEVSGIKPTKPVLYQPTDESTTEDNTPTFEWENSQYAENHRIEVDNDVDFSSTEDNETVLADNSWTKTGDGYSNGTYYWRVFAVNENGETKSDAWTFVVSTAAWQLIETWTGTIEAPAAWQLIESWTGTVEAPAEWQLIETWTGTVQAPAAWQLIESWTGTVEAPAEWQLIETWTGTVRAPAAWQLIETWTGTVESPVVAEWQLIETWTGTVQAPAAWQLIETWTGTVEAPTTPTPVPPPAPLPMPVFYALLTTSAALGGGFGMYRRWLRPIPPAVSIEWIRRVAMRGKREVKLVEVRAADITTSLERPRDATRVEKVSRPITPLLEGFKRAVVWKPKPVKVRITKASRVDVKRFKRIWRATKFKHRVK